MQKSNLKIYKCSECGLSYTDEKMAKKCGAWCREHKTCNVEIIKHSLEQQKHVRN